MTDPRASLDLVLACAAGGLLLGPVSERVARRYLPALPLGGSRTVTAVLAVTTAAVFGLFAWRFGDAWVLPGFLFLGTAGILLARIDLQFKVLPNILVIPALGTGLVLLAIDAALNERWGSLVAAGAGAAAAFIIYLVLALISPRGLGMGDVKFSALLGLYLGYLSLGHLILGVTLGFVVGAVTGVVLLLAGITGRRDTLPFGPAMFAGCVAAVVFGQEIGSAVLSPLFPQ